MSFTTSALRINRAYYNTNASLFCERANAISMDPAYSRFIKAIPARSHILDAGCGSGRDATAFLSRGYQVTAIDASPAMVDRAQRLGVNASVMTFQKLAFFDEFDAIWASASLLHIPRERMLFAVRRLSRALKSRGILYVSLKEGEGENVAEDGRFFSYFHENEFSQILTRECSFKIIDSWKDNNPDSSGTIRPWLNFLAKKKL